MSAIRYHYNGGLTACGTLVNPDTKPVQIRAKTGELVRVSFLGFICQAAVKLFPDGTYAKMACHEISAGDGAFLTPWQRVPKDHFVLCLRVAHQRYVRSESTSNGVLVIVDNTGMPITMPHGGVRGDNLKKVGSASYK